MSRKEKPRHESVIPAHGTHCAMPYRRAARRPDWRIDPVHVRLIARPLQRTRSSTLTTKG
jgi:hypothetical protein